MIIPQGINSNCFNNNLNHVFIFNDLKDKTILIIDPYRMKAFQFVFRASK